ncbi:MAG: M48 family metallopeptidase [Saprospiraceae bacterium]
MYLIKQYCLVCLAILLSFMSFAQTGGTYLGRTYNNKLPASFRLNSFDVRDHIYNGIPEELKKSVYERDCYRFADATGLQVTNLVASGELYSDWKAYEDYLNQIMQNIMPEELKKDTSIHAYLIRNGNYNAFMTPSGKTFFHVGLLSEVENEATIAGVMAHELAHYYKQHSLKSFIKAQKGEFDNNIFIENKSQSKFSISNELQSDSLAMVWLSNSGYSLDGLVEGFKIMERLEQNYLDKTPNKWEREATTHPLSEDRSKAMTDYIKKNADQPKGKLFVQDEALFKTLSKQAKAETLKLLLNGFQYTTCTELAFKYHIFDVNNPTYVYYLMESIRRRCYLNTTIWKKNFITDRYFKEVKAESDRVRRKKIPVTDHLFKEIPIGILRLNIRSLRNLEAKFYWQDLKFSTYEEAFEFFYKISELLKDPECTLSYALSITQNEKIRNQYLEKYLAFENIEYRDFAQNLLDNTFRKNLKNQKLCLMNNFRAAVMQGKEEFSIRTFDVAGNSKISKLFSDALKGMEGRTVVYMPDMKKGDLNDYRLLQELEKFSKMRTISIGQKAELHIMNPRYWQIMNKYEVNEIEFMNAFYTEKNKKDRTIEGYKELSELGLEDFLKREKTMKFLFSYISSVRMIENVSMKTLYAPSRGGRLAFMGFEEKLKYKLPAYDQVSKALKIRFIEKDKATSKRDKRVNNGN